MKVGGLFLVVLLPSACVLAPFGQDVSRNDTWAKGNAPAADFDWFRARFHRSDQFNSPQFDRRLFFFLVGKRKLVRRCVYVLS